MIMKAYFVIAMLFELFLVLYTGKMVDRGLIGTAVTTGLCAIILAIICAAYIVVWGLKKKKGDYHRYYHRYIPL